MQSTRMLEGYRVLDLSQYLAGAGVTRMMAEMGADIVKVEIPPMGDPGRVLPFVKDGRSSFFIHINRGKRSLCVDWDTPEGLQLVKDLVPHCDVVVENFGHGVLEKRGLDYPGVRELNPKIVMASVSAFGRTGPWSDRPGFDGIAQAFSGLMHMTGDPERPPAAVGFAISDSSAAVHAFAALGYALLHRERTGVGQHIDIAMVDVMFHLSEVISQYDLSGGEYRPNRMGQHHPLVCPVGIYRLPDGWCILMCLDRQWPYLVEAMGRPDLGTDPRFNPADARAVNQAELIPQIQDWLLSFPDNDSVLEVCRQRRIPIAPCLDPIDAIDHPHYQAREMVRRVPDPVVGDVLIPGFPFKFSAQPDLPDLVAPLLGEHNGEVLGEILGLDAATVDELTGRGVLYRSDR
ncbi:MAG: CoA transferase [Acidimicrobiia bacterium]|nr:CoA transferase [Acidimicrobiia bacterium]